MEVASLNIEKNGYTSAQQKQGKVDHFISSCVDNKVGIIFLCEVHGALETTYDSFLTAAYHNYNVNVVHGGASNSYIILWAKSKGITFIGTRQLTGLNRYLAIFRWNGTAIGLAHFKSGGNDLTIHQIQESATYLDGYSGRNWMITGDINLAYQRRGELTGLPNDTKFLSYWGHEPTQKKGNTLDWALYGKYTRLNSWHRMRNWPRQLFNMGGPDHRPVVYRIGGFYS